MKLNARVFPDSGVDFQVRLIDVAQVAIKEDADFQKMLNAITDGKAPVGLSGKSKRAVNKSSADYRDDIHADVVSVFVASRTKAGLAWPMMRREPQFASKAFSIVNCNVADEYLAFAHELGHNFGCCHEMKRHQGACLTPYGFGYEFMAANRLRRTIMCEGNPRLELFSNPNKAYLGQAAGAKDAFNAKVMNESAALVAKFR